MTCTLPLQSSAGTGRYTATPTRGFRTANKRSERSPDFMFDEPMCQLPMRIVSRSERVSRHWRLATRLDQQLAFYRRMGITQRLSMSVKMTLTDHTFCVGCGAASNLVADFAIALWRQSRAKAVSDNFLSISSKGTRTRLRGITREKRN